MNTDMVMNFNVDVANLPGQVRNFSIEVEIDGR